MKRRILSPKVGAAVMAATMMMSICSPVMAAGTNYTETIGGEKTTTFDKYLVMDKQAEVPNATFAYTVTAGNAKTYSIAGDGGTSTFEILAGVDADLVTMAGVDTDEANKIAYHQGDTTANDANTYIKGGYDNTVKKYAKKTATLDFSACKFTEPGVYRYILTETDTTNQAITNDADSTRVIDVYVYDDSDGETKKLKIAGYVLHSDTDDEPVVEMGTDAGSSGSYKNGTKSQGFTNDYDTSDLTIRKEVTGNQASRDKYFEFTVEIKDAVPGTVYDVDITGADAESKTNNATIADNREKTNPTTLTVGADKTVTQKFYLQHGQEIKIQGIAKDSTYTVTENKEDYKSTAAGVEGYKDATTGTIGSTDLKTSYLNTRDGVIPTGVMMAVAPFAVVTLFGGAGLVTMSMRKRKED